MSARLRLRIGRPNSENLYLGMIMRPRRHGLHIVAMRSLNASISEFEKFENALPVDSPFAEGSFLAGRHCLEEIRGIRSGSSLPDEHAPQDCCALPPSEGGPWKGSSPEDSPKFRRQLA